MASDYSSTSYAEVPRMETATAGASPVRMGEVLQQDAETRRAWSQAEVSGHIAGFGQVVRGASGDTSSSSGDSDLPDLDSQAEVCHPAPEPVASQPSPPAAPEPVTTVQDVPAIDPLLLDRSPAGAIACRREVMDRLHRDNRERRESAAALQLSPVIDAMTTGDARPSPQDLGQNSHEDQSMALELERERLMRREAERMAQENAEKLSQAQSQLAELERDHHPDTDLPHSDADDEGLDGETMSIQEAIGLENAKLQAHRSSPEAGQEFQHTTEAIILAAHMLIIVA